jgi:hypothetical protein
MHNAVESKNDMEAMHVCPFFLDESHEGNEKMDGKV